MLAILYLVLCAAFGICFVGLCVPDVRRLYIASSSQAKAITHIPNTLFTVPAGIITGLLCVPFFNYYITLGLTYFLDNSALCMKLGVLITFAFFIWMILTCLVLINRKRIKREELKASGSTTIEDYKHNVLDSIFYGAVIILITIAATFLMFYTYRIDGGRLYNGSSTFSDLSPHTAMISSFGKGFNFPTQYMHFSGDGIKYHFFFYFLAGMLQHLGLPIDYALNLPSIITMVSTLVLLGLLAMLISSRRAAFAVAPILVFLRSSINAFVHLKELMASGLPLVSAIKEILAFDQWYQVTDYDNWGLWAINVYPNQRHLMLGVGVIVLMVILFLPFVRRIGIAVSRAESFGEAVKAFAFSKTAWLVRSEDPLYPVSIAFLACVLVIVMPYFHGSCLIALLLVLFGMAIFSESRLLYLAVAICAVVSSFIQTLVFSGGYNNVVSFVFKPGFIVNNPTFTNVASYLFNVTGLTLILAAAFALITLILDIIHKKPVHRFLLFICALNPLIFAFLFQVTLEMLANHKFIQISLILVDAFVAALVANLLYIPFKLRKPEKERPTIAVEADGIIDANSADGDYSEVAESDAGVRTPVLPSASAFGEAEEDEKEEALDIKALDSHTGIDADVSSLNGGSSSDSSDKKEDKEEPAKELLFGDEKGEEEDEEEDSEEEPSDSEDDSEEVSEETEETTAEDEKSEEEKTDDSEAKAGVAAIAALFGEEIKPADNSESADASEEKKEDDSEESTEDTTEEGDSDEPVKESTNEPAHVAMRPGSIVMSDVKFGEGDEEDDEDNVVIASADAVIDGSSDNSDEDEEELKPESIKHVPVESKKASGLSLPAWIALEVAGVILALALLIPLTATGVSEWATYINKNSNPYPINTNSPLTKWVVENTEPTDVFLTPYWSMDRFILAGRPMYYGWPYYAWSAGHDTNTRNTIYNWLISGCDDNIDEFTRYCKERNIRYLIVDGDFLEQETDEGVRLNTEFIDKNLKQVAYFAEEDAKVYKIF